ncbi:MarR family transcriptional regulator [Nakamurella silvestris]|nr:MarR family transcriptional regulator [Nakamurella silvestris]
MPASERAQRRRSPDPAQLRAWRAYIETAQVVRSTIGSQLLADSGLSNGDYAVLLALSEAPGHRLRSTPLARAIHWERSRLSHHLGRMERRELISREGSATDNRGAEIVLTPSGTTAFRRATVPHLRLVQELFVDALSAEQLAALEDASRALGRHLQERLDGTAGESG